ncbi:hypothetical protein [Streptomyces sp. NPDC127038]|uniref:hypothetical protein n=1 Tax=Streptomyces sp. NPDC127038 TaxID=3347114 RepID=UPI003665B92C
MSSLLGGLGEKLVDKWVSALAVPGLLLMAASAAAAVLGQADALDVAALRARAGQEAARAGEWSTVAQLAALGAVVLGSVAVGGLVRAFAGAAERVWTGAWPAPADRLAARLTDRRKTRWQGLQTEIITRGDAMPIPAPSRPDYEVNRAEIDRLTALRDRIALAEPQRPTMTGDRFAGTGTRLRNQYGIDLASSWTRLWLVLPDTVQAELRASRAGFGAAVEGTTWAACYFALGLCWWPAALIGLTVGLLAWSRGRRAAVLHAQLVESAADLHLKTLAAEFGLASTASVPDLTPASEPDSTPASTPGLPPGFSVERKVGLALNRIFRKGT